MKILDIALKDLTRSFRSAFALFFMFVIPLVVPVLFFFMFGSTASEEEAFEVVMTKVVLVNLDQGGSQFTQAMSRFPSGVEGESLGALIANVLQSPDFTNLLEVRLEMDAATARDLVDSQQADVALIIPADFSAQFTSFDGQAVLEFYRDPTLTIGPGIVKSLLNQLMDDFSGAKITVNVALAQVGATDPALIGKVVSRYLATQLRGNPSAALLKVQSPSQEKPARSPVLVIVGMVMGAMLIFYAYYTGVATAQSILKEDEQRTLPRLFTTPTSPTAILTGKLLGVLLTVIVQVIVLFIAARLIFRVEWGNWPSLLLTAVCLILNASALGIFVNSLLKNSKQGGFVYGGVLTITWTVGAMPLFVSFGGYSNPTVNAVSLTMPQGWIMRMFMDGIHSASLERIAVSALVTLAWTAIFFLIGVWRFRRRYL